MSTANRTGEDRSRGCPPILSLRGIPKILEEAKKRIAKYFDRPLDVFPEFAKIHGGTRIQRAERRWACLRVLYAYLEYVQLAGMRIGEYQDDGSFQGRLTAELIRIAGIERARFYRAQRDFINVGWVSSQQQRIQQPDGTWICLPAIRALNARVFAAVGLLPRLKHEMERATARLFNKLTRETLWPPRRSSVSFSACIATPARHSTARSAYSLCTTNTPTCRSKRFSSSPRTRKALSRRARLLFSARFFLRGRPPQ